MRTDTHLPYTVLVQRWRRSTLGGRVAGGGHFQVTVGAAAPGVTFFGAPRHSVSDWRRSQRGSVRRCEVVSRFGPQNKEGSDGPGIIVRCKKQSLSTIRGEKNDSDCRLSDEHSPPVRDAPVVLLDACESACVWRHERASDALTRNSAGSMLPSQAVGNVANAASLGR